MQTNRWVQVLGALLLIAVGALALAQNWGFQPAWLPTAWGVLFLAGGAAFFLGYAVERAGWWQLIPGFALAGLGLLILLAGTNLAPGEAAAAVFFLCLAAGFGAAYLAGRRESGWALIPGGVMLTLALVILAAGYGSGELAGAVFFLVLGLGFVALYFVEIGGRRQNWWALIPAGSLLSLAAVVALSRYDGAAAGSALFVGLGVTFGALYLLRSPDRPTHWAWVPSLALLAFGLFVYTVAGAHAYGWVLWSLALIVAGLALLVRAWRRQVR